MRLRERDYQTEAINSIFTYFENNHGNPVIGMPTGTGKSVVIAGFLERVYHHWPNQKILVLTHVKELVEQNCQKLLTVWPQAPCGINSAGLKRRDYDHRVIFGGIGSVARNADRFGHVDLVMIDECHMVSGDEKSQYRKFIFQLKERNPLLKVIGLTATPWRLGMGHICQSEKSIFTDMCIDLTAPHAFARFFDEGYLCRVIPKRQSFTLDVDGVHTRGGDFVENELQLAVNKESITRQAIEEVLRVAGDRKKWLLFCTGIEHTLSVAEILQEYGINAAAIHSKLDGKERDRILHEYKHGDIQAVTNNNVLTTGFDHPGIDLIVVLRPTQSTVLWVQMLGRGTRVIYADGFDLSTIEGRLMAIEASEKKDCLVMDFAGNTGRIGEINDPLIPREKGKGKGEAPTKACEACGLWQHTSHRHCVSCGEEFIFQLKIDNKASSDELIKTDMPVYEDFEVNHITYSIHTKKDKPPIMKVSYHNGLRTFEDYVCLEHDGFAGKKARDWWRNRVHKVEREIDGTMFLVDAMEPPETSIEAVRAHEYLKTPTHIKVHVNVKFPKIVSYCYDGTCFGTIENQNKEVTTDTLVFEANKGKAKAKPTNGPSPDEFEF